MHASHAVKQQNFDQQGKSSASFTPYIPASANIAEFTVKAVVLGIIFGMLFGAITAFLGLKAGLTVNASIPIAVIGIMILKRFRSTILENNIVQATGSAGEAIAAGVIFTLPAMIFLGYELEYWKVTFFALCGGCLGVLFMVPLRRALIVKEHGTLPYPEGTACADILIAGEKKGEMAKRVFQGAGLGFAYGTLMKLFRMWNEEPTWVSQKALPGATFSIEASPALLGVGYIIGPRSASIMVAGSALAWLGLIPLIKFFGSAGNQIIAPSFIPLSEMSPGQIWSNYVRYIGAGAVVVGGFYNLIKAMPMIVDSFRSSLRSLGGGKDTNETKSRTENDLPNSFVFGGSLALITAIWMLLSFVINPGHLIGNFVASLLIVIFGFFFVTVSCRVVGTIGTTSNPISGDTIATLMITCLIFLLFGWTGGAYSIVALSVGAIIAIAAANAGTTSQDLKTGYIIGGTPKYQQIGILLGAVFSALAIGATLIAMNNTYRTFTPMPAAITVPAENITANTVEHEGKTYKIGIVKTATEQLPAGRYAVDETGMTMLAYQDGIGGKDFPAPQGRLMSLVIDGILNQKLPWVFVLVGAIIALVMILCGVTQVLAFAVGLYLPIATMTPVFLGGLMRALVNRKKAKDAARGESVEEESEASAGSLYSAGLVAGGAVASILLMPLIGIDFLRTGFYKWCTEIGPKYLGHWSESNTLAALTFVALALSIYFVGLKKIDSKS